MFVTNGKKLLIIKWPCLTVKNTENILLAKKKSLIGSATQIKICAW